MIRKVSKKKAKELYKQKKTYAALAEQREGTCSGCGQWSYILDNSHLLSQYKYPQYLAEAWNIKKMCRSCHVLWENPTQRHRLLDYEENMQIIREHDERAYLQMVGLMELKQLKFKNATTE